MSNRIELSELETFLYASADILRGYVEASDYKSYVFPLLFFKRVCDVYDEETENAVKQYGEDLEHYEFSGERWLMYKILQDEVTIQKLNKNHSI